MSIYRGYYYDGRSSAGRLVTLERDGTDLKIRGEGLDLSLPADSARLSPKVGGGRRSIRFANGALCELTTDAQLEQLLGVDGGRLHRLLYHWERSLPLATLALVLTLAVVVCFIRFAVPAIAKHAALAIPAASEAALGKDSLAFLDKYLMKPSTLPEERQRQAKAVFRDLQAKLPEAKQYRVELRSAPSVGANAFALPGGTIVVTDAMVELAVGKDQLIGVLAHEAAHERSRHALRQVLQSTGTGLLIAALTGDITSITSLAATLPTALIDAGYSREFENEADDAAVSFLKKAGISPKIYADTLASLQAEHDKKTEEKGSRRRWSLLELFSTHPQTPDRIKRILGEK
jgi:Zn-dependent protease with chaperone function